MQDKKFGKYQGQDRRNTQEKFAEGFRRAHVAIRRNLHMGGHAVAGSTDSVPQTYKERQTYARAAEKYTGNLQDGDPQKITAMLMARIPDYAYALSVLPDKRDHNPKHRKPFISHEQREIEVAKTIRYNDALREIIDHNQSIHPDTIIKIVSGTMMRLGYSDEERELVAGRTQGDLKGMRHELAFESVLYYLPEGFEIIETTDEDDAHAADYIVRCPNGVEVSIDVKATPRLQEEAMERRANWAQQHGRRIPANEIILYSGFDNRDDFDENSPWRPSHEAIMRVLPHLEKRLLEASGDYSTPARALAH